MRDTALLDELHRFALFEPTAHALFTRAARIAAHALDSKRLVVAIGAGERILTRSFDERGAAASAGNPEVTRRVTETGVPVALEESLDESDGGMGAGWAGVPLVAHGVRFGALAVVAQGPRAWTSADLCIVQEVAAGVVEVLELQVDLATSRRKGTHLASQKEVLGMIARGAPVKEVMGALASHVEHQTPGSLCAIWLRGTEGRLEVVALPTAPESLLTGCSEPGVAAWTPVAARALERGELAVVADSAGPGMEGNPFAAHLRHHDVRARWSAPVVVDGESVGMIDVYRSAPGEPAPADSEMVSVATAIARIAVEREAAEETLRRSEEYFRSLIENSEELTLVLDEQGSARYASPSARRVLGLGDGAGSLAEAIEPQDHSRMVELLNELARDGGTASFDFRTTAPLEERYFSAIASNLLDNPAVRGVVVNALDITERKTAEGALRASEERYRLVSRSTNDVVWDWDLGSGRVVWTEALERVFGYRAAGPDAEWWKERIHPADIERVMEHLQAALDGEAETFLDEYRFRRADGGYAVVVDRAVISRAADGTARRIVGSLADVTHRRELEEQLRQSQRMEAVGRLAGGIAHDFNNLLTAMTGFVELLREQLDEPHSERVGFLDEISRAAERASSLTRQLLAFSRRQVLQPKLLDPNEVVRGIEPMLRRLITESIVVETDLEPTTDHVWADLGQLEQVIVNLAVNARDAMRHGGSLRIAAATETVTERQSRSGAQVPPGSYACITVSDTGHGIPPDILPQIFEPFFTTKQSSNGTGLGLSTVYGIVKQSDGHITVDSEPGRGTVFRIYLPATGEEPASEPARAGKLEPVAGSERVLVVEDDNAVRDLTRRILERSGYDVVTVADGVAALQTLTEGEFRPDVLLTDVVLPRMSGPDVAERIAELVPEVRVVFMSGYTDEHLGDHGIIGADVLFLQKPFTPRFLAETVRAACDRGPGGGVQGEAGCQVLIP